MSTTASRPDVATRRDGREMEEVLAPEMFSFDAPGDCVAGILLSVGKVVVGGKPVTQYLVRLEGGDKCVRFLATYDLAQKLQPQHLNRFVEVAFVGENKEVKKGNNYLREFRVRVEKARAQDDLEITDADIPF